MKGLIRALLFEKLRNEHPGNYQYGFLNGAKLLIGSFVLILIGVVVGSIVYSFLGYLLIKIGLWVQFVGQMRIYYSWRMLKYDKETARRRELFDTNLSIHGDLSLCHGLLTRNHRTMTRERAILNWDIFKFYKGLNPQNETINAFSEFYRTRLAFLESQKWKEISEERQKDLLKALFLSPYSDYKKLIKRIEKELKLFV